MSYSVYIAVNIRNGKRYIGVTGKGVEHRSQKHWEKARAGGNECPRFYAAMRKYGPDAFAWKVLFVGEDRMEAYRQEFQFVRDLSPEYNSIDGGLGAPGLDPWNRREVVCLEDGVVHRSAMDAAKFYSIDLSELCKVLRGQNRWAKGLHFAYANEAVVDLAKLIDEIDSAFIQGMRRVKNRKARHGAVVNGKDSRGRSAAGPMAMYRKIVCINDGAVFDSISSAARHYDIDAGSISRVCGGFRDTAAGKRFRFLDDGSEAVN